MEGQNHSEVTLKTPQHLPPVRLRWQRHNRPSINRQSPLINGLRQAKPLHPKHRLGNEITKQNLNI